MGMFLDLVSAQKCGLGTAVLRTYVEDTRAEEKKTASNFQKKIHRIEELSEKKR